MSRYGLGVGGPALISAISTAVFTRLFDPEEFGLFTVAFAAVSLAVSFAGQWLQQPLGRYMAGASEPRAMYLIQGAWLGLIGFAVLTIIALLLAWIFHVKDQTVYAKFWLPGVLLFWAQLLFSTATVILQARMFAGLYSKLQVLLAVSRFAASFLLFWLVGHQSVMLLWGVVIATVIVLPSALESSGLRKYLTKLAHNFADAWLTLREMSRYGLPMMGWFVASNVMSSSDRIVIGVFRGSAEAGIYGANYNLMNGTVGLVTAPVLAATWPFLMKAWGSGNAKEAGQWLGSIVSWVLAGGLLLCGASALLAKDLAAVLLGPSFREGAIVMPTVVGGMVALAVATYAHKPFEFYERMLLMMLLAIGAAVANLVLNLALVPQYGYMASAWITLACYTLYAACSVVIGRRMLAWCFDTRLIGFVILGAGLGCAVGGVLLHELPGMPVLLRLLAGGCCYGICVLISVLVPYRVQVRKLIANRRSIRAV